jgi:hypothetical protein
MAAVGVGWCLGFGLGVVVEAMAAVGVGHCLGFERKAMPRVTVDDLG